MLKKMKRQSWHQDFHWDGQGINTGMSISEGQLGLKALEIKLERQAWDEHGTCAG